MLAQKKHQIERAITYRVRKDFVKALKLKARKEGRRLGDVVDELLNSHIFDKEPYLDYGPKEPHAYIIKRSTIPKVKTQAFTEKKSISYVVNRALDRYFSIDSIVNKAKHVSA